MISVPLICFTSCKNDDKLLDFKQGKVTSLNSPPPGFNTIQDFRNEIREIYAEAIAKSMKQIEVRTFIKHKIAVNPTIETEFLHAQYMLDIVNDTMNLIDYLVLNSNKSSAFFEDTIPQYDPRLTVLIPDDYEPNTWDTSSLIPKVVAPPTEWDDTIGISLAYFDTSGRISDLNSNSQPSTLTVVIGETEDLIPFIKPYTGQNGPAVFDNEWYEYFPRTGVYFFEGESEKTETPSKGTVTGRSCSRDNSTKKDMLHAAKINGESELNRLEHWTRGKAELYCVIVFNQSASLPAASSVRKNVDVTRKQGKNQNWVDIKSEVIRWSNVNIMNNMSYSWFEEDGGAPVTHTASLTVIVNGVTFTLTTTYNVRNADDVAGSSIVEYCDEVNWGGTDYNATGVTFNVRQ